MLKLRDDCRSSGCDQLVWKSYLRNWDAPKNFQCRWRGKRIFPMSALECAFSLIKAGKINTFDSQSFDSNTCKNDINYRVECANLVKMNFFYRAAVYLRLGFCYSLKDRNRMVSDELGKVAFLDQISNFRQTLLRWVLAMAVR